MVISSNFRRFSPYFKRLGLDTVDPAFYEKIQRWESWYRNNVPGFHSYNVMRCRGGTVKCRRKSLGMASKLAQDIADLMMNEDTLVTLSDPTTDEFVKGVLGGSSFATKCNEYQERKAATGTVAYVPYIADAQADDDGNVSGGTVKVNYVSARHIFPTSWGNGDITECVFAFERKYRRRKYTLMQRHALEHTEDGGRQYVITNAVIDGRGREILPAEWQEIPAFSGMSERIETGSDAPQFAIDRLAIVNNAADDDSNPMGIPIFANSIDVLAKLDTEYDSYDNEFLLGRKRIFVAPEMLQDEQGRLLFDPNDSVFYMLPEDFFQNTKEAMHEVNMAIRAEEHERAINQDLSILSMKAGLGTQYYRFERGNIETATQVISENSDLYRTIRKHEIPLADTLRTLIRSIIRLGIVTGRTDLDPDCEIVIRFDDSIIEDKATEREEDRKDVAMGVMSHVEYRAKWYGETEEQAAKRIPEQLQGAGVLL